MKRSYAYALIVFAIAILSSLVWLHFHLVGQTITPLLTQASDINQRVIEQQKGELRSVRKQMEQLIEYPLRSRYYKPLLDISNEMKSNVEEYLQARKMIDKNKASTKELELLAHKLMKELVLTAKEVYTEHQQAFDLSDDSLKDRLNELAEYGKKVKLTGNSRELGNEAVNQYYSDMVTLGFLSKYLDILYQAASTISLPCFEFKRYYPIVTTNVANPRPGEQINAQIAIATFPYLNPENVEVIIGQDTFGVDQDGLAKYSLKAGSRGEHTVPVICRITNPLTGEAIREESVYTYRVY